MGVLRRWMACARGRRVICQGLSFSVQGEEEATRNQQTMYVSMFWPPVDAMSVQTIARIYHAQSTMSAAKQRPKTRNM